MRIQFSKVRTEWGICWVRNHWYYKFLDLYVLPFLSVHFSRGNRAHLEPNKIGILYGWLVTSGSVWITWPYADKYVEIAFNYKNGQLASEKRACAKEIQ